MKESTLCVHSGFDTDRNIGGDTGGLGIPVYQTSTYDQEDLSKNQKYDYSRSGNPTREALEQTIALLEGGKRGCAFGSGIAAIASTLGIFSTGDHLVAAEDIYGGSFRILNTFFKRWGLEVTFVDATDLQAVAGAIRPNTRGLFLETPSNPLLKITDLRGCCALAREAGIISIVDNTFMSPCLQKPLSLGADISLHSATKFLGGHSDAVLGLAVAAEEELGRRIYHVQNSFGAIAGPWDSWLVLRGIKTLKVRMDYECASAGRLALWLKDHPKVEAVYYPGLPDHPGHDLNARQAGGAGAVLSFKTRSREEALNFFAKTKLAASAVSLGSVETIASYPVRMSHASMPPAQREKLGVTDTLIRLSLGLEDPQDLIEDFDQALG
ncbi:MAG: PLP-dependent transferase [Spirochaetales bacterium]|jgi:cystathionine beta-lyase|nr:PLP-dependent transferase [Spirochaetales bacterium]